MIIKPRNQQGLITIIFILLMALIATMLLVVGTSRVLLSLQRGKSASDTLITTYQAESEINDVLLKLRKGLFTNADFARFPIKKTFDNGAFTVEIDGEIDGDNQIITATAKRFFAVSKVQAIRATNTASTVSEIDLVLLLDCTGSMNARASTTSTTTRMYEQKEAAKAFVQQIADHPNGDFINLGVATFSNNTEWLRTTSGIEAQPSANIAFQTIWDSIDDGFETTRENSSACDNHRGYTNVGGGYNFAQEYFKTSPLTNAEKVVVLVTDGEPTSRTEDAACAPSEFCENCERKAMNYLQCVITPNNVRWNGLAFGKRDPDVTAFAVTVLDPPRQDVKTLFENAIGEENYFTTSNATELSEKLDAIFQRVIASVTQTTINRVIPLETQ